MANHLKELQEQKLKELKLVVNKDELQQYYNSHTYRETQNHYGQGWDSLWRESLKVLLLLL